MSKTVTLRLHDSIYEKIQSIAKSDNRTLSNFIETSTLRYIESIELVDDYEMEGMRNDNELNKSLQRAYRDIKSQKGRFVE